jgi:catechol 2,3-dioxygenase-like lactoylglutathione lyase family enzyme
LAVPRIRHLAIRCRDVDRSVRFYRDGFGFQEVGPRGLGMDLTDQTLNLTILPFVGTPAPASEEGLARIIHRLA